MSNKDDFNVHPTLRWHRGCTTVNIERTRPFSVFIAIVKKVQSSSAIIFEFAAITKRQRICRSSLIPDITHFLYCHQDADTTSNFFVCSHIHNLSKLLFIFLKNHTHNENVLITSFSCMFLFEILVIK